MEAEHEKIQENSNKPNKKTVLLIILFLVSTMIFLSIIIFMFGFRIGYADNTETIYNKQNLIKTSEPNNNIPIPLPSGNSTLSGKVRLIPRIEWLAQPATYTIDPLHLPVPNVIILHTATDICTDHEKCIAIVRYTQQFHIESKGWWDIAFNFLVGGDGYVYEGRGWKGMGANAYGWNNKSIAIAFVGTFNEIPPPANQIKACKLIIQKGVDEGYIAKDYKLFAHRQLSNTQSPGDALYEDMKTWPHWAEVPDENTS